MDANQEHLIKYHKNLREVFKTPNGKELLEAWEKIYVEARALDQTPELTYYRLGQKELIQSIIQDSNTDVSDFQDLVKGG